MGRRDHCLTSFNFVVVDVVHDESMLCPLANADLSLKVQSMGVEGISSVVWLAYINYWICFWILALYQGWSLLSCGLKGRIGITLVIRLLPRTNHRLLLVDLLCFKFFTHDGLWQLALRLSVILRNVLNILVGVVLSKIVDNICIHWSCLALVVQQMPWRHSITFWRRGILPHHYWPFRTRVKCHSQNASWPEVKLVLWVVKPIWPWLFLDKLQVLVIDWLWLHGLERHRNGVLSFRLPFLASRLASSIGQSLLISFASLIKFWQELSYFIWSLALDTLVTSCRYVRASG